MRQVRFSRCPEGRENRVDVEVKIRVETLWPPSASLLPVAPSGLELNCWPMMQSLASLDPPANQSAGVGGLSVRLTLVNRREGGRDFEFPRAALCCHPCSAFLLPLCTLSVSLRRCTGQRRRRGKEGRKEEWSARGGTRKEVGGRSDLGHGCHGALPTGLLHTDGRLPSCRSCDCFSFFPVWLQRSSKEVLCKLWARPVPGPFPGSLSQTAFLSVSTCPPVELKMFLISCGGFPPSPFFSFPFPRVIIKGLDATAAVEKKACVGN